MNYLLDHIWGAMAALAGGIACYMTWLNGQKLQAITVSDIEGRLGKMEEWKAQKSIDRVDMERVHDGVVHNADRIAKLEVKYEAAFTVMGTGIQSVEKALIRLEGQIKNSDTLSNLVSVSTQKKLDELQRSVEAISSR